MKFIYLTDQYNHYYKSMCSKLYEIYGDEFKMILTIPMKDELLKLGFKDNSIGIPYVIRAYEENEDYIYKLCNESDFLIYGAAPFKYVKNRIENNKYTFCFTERIFKNGLKSLLKVKNLKILYNNFTKYRNNKNFYILATGYYAPKDFTIIGMKKSQILNWGYFPTVKNFNESELLSKKSISKIKLIWIGRFVSLKHPEVAIKGAKFLKDHQVDFELNFIGMGELENKLKALINFYELNENVKLLGSKPADEVRNYMEEANIFLFNSNYKEGWGASLSESMASGCCPIVSSAVGGANVLIENNKTGFIYKYNNQEQFNDLLLNACKNITNTNQIGINAYSLMKETWNGENAIEKLIEFINSKNENKLFNYSIGPCSDPFKN